MEAGKVMDTPFVILTFFFLYLGPVWKYLKSMPCCLSPRSELSRPNIDSLPLPTLMNMDFQLSPVSLHRRIHSFWLGEIVSCTLWIWKLGPSQ